MTDQINFKETLESYQAPRGAFRIVGVPDMQYLMVDGHGDPNASPAHSGALAALYPRRLQAQVHQQARARPRLRRPSTGGTVVGRGHGCLHRRARQVPVGLDDAADGSRLDRSRHVPGAVEQAGATSRPARLDDIRLQTLSEGRCVHTLHIGSFDDEGPTLERMHHEFIPEHGLRVPEGTRTSTSATSVG